MTIGTPRRLQSLVPRNPTPPRTQRSADNGEAKSTNHLSQYRNIRGIMAPVRASSGLTFNSKLFKVPILIPFFVNLVIIWVCLEYLVYILIGLLYTCRVCNSAYANLESLDFFSQRREDTTNPHPRILN